ncbi:MAG: zinc ribbon domain-containing protein [Nitrospinae bacterium]|nr:zinc ribbon domain-containing protein [Nitrospinota bacterium]
MTLFMTILLAASAAFFVGFPFWQKGLEEEIPQAPPGEAGFSALLSRKEEAYRTIKELELDHQMGKLSDEDYRELSQRYKAVALGILKEIDQRYGGVKTIEEEIEEEILELRRRRRLAPKEKSAERSSFCTQCGAQLQPADRFCGRCGQRVEQ